MTDPVRPKVTGIGGVFFKAEAQPNGRFAHLMGPEGMKIELWEPVDPDPYDP